MYEINGEKCSSGNIALDVLKETETVHKFSMEVPNIEPIDPDEKPVGILEYLISMSEMMDKMNADFARAVLNDCKKFKGRYVEITMRDKPPGRLERALRKMGWAK
jgi:hypothetical protein